MIVIILVVATLVLLYKFINKNGKYWEKKNIPHEKPLPFIGNIAGVILGKETFGMAVARVYQTMAENVPYFGFYAFNQPYLVLKSPEIIKQVLIKDFNSFPNRPVHSNENIDRPAANIIFILKNDAWREVRKKVTPIFTAGKLRLMYPLFQEVTDELEKQLEKSDNQDIDVKDLGRRYSVDTICSSAFGINANSVKDENSIINTMVLRMFDIRRPGRILAAFSYFFCPILVEILRLPMFEKEPTEYLMNVFNNVSEERKKMKVKRHDLIDCLHSIQTEETESDTYKFDDQWKMSVQALTFLNGGSEPGGLIIAYTLYHLALQPEIQKKLRTEILENIDSEGSISYEKLNEMKYLDMVMKEGLRMYPLVQILFRYAEKDYTFEDTGLTIEKGTRVLIPMLALHHDSKYYPDPHKFDPERFGVDKPLSSVYLAFGEGPRKCIGDRFALIQMKIAIAMFLKNHEVAPCEKTEIPIKWNMRSFFMMPKSGKIYLNVKRVNA